MSLKSAAVRHIKRESETRVHFTIWLDPELEYFRGHFPAAPILPGIVQLGWAIRYAKEVFPNSGSFHSVEALKFQQILQPGQIVELELEYRPEKKSVLFLFRSERGKHASGSLLLSEP